MRDNHKGMDEIIDAFEKDGHYFGIIEIGIDEIRKRFQFGVSYKNYLALKRILQLQPFDEMPGLKYRYFIATSYWKIADTSDCGVSVRVEQGRNGKQIDMPIPKELFANLIWFSEIKSFDEASHLLEVE